MHSADPRTAGQVAIKQTHRRSRCGTGIAWALSWSQTLASITISSTLTNPPPLAPESGGVLVSARMMGRLLPSDGV